MQTSYELFLEALKFLTQESKHERIRVKFLCKIYEALTHLMCEPLLFDRGEEYLKKAESIMEQNKEYFDQIA
jgi:hypothetical protein